MLLYVLDLAGVAVFAISGALAAGRKCMDFFGVIVIAIVTAIGGGTIRDLLLGRYPIFWIHDTAYLTVIIATAGATPLYARFKEVPGKALLVADALWLAVFTVIGAQVAEQEHLPGIIVAMVAAITGAAGGVARDVLCNEIPVILRKDIYATASLAGAVVYLLAKKAALGTNAGMLMAMATVVVLRLAANFFGWHVPRFVLKEMHMRIYPTPRGIDYGNDAYSTARLSRIDKDSISHMSCPFGGKTGSIRGSIRCTSCSGTRNITRTRPFQSENR